MELPVFDQSVVLAEDETCKLLMHPTFLSETEADHLYRVCLEKLEFRDHVYTTTGGKRVDFARLLAVQADEGLSYQYFGSDFLAAMPHKWVPEIRSLTDRVNAYTGGGFNGLFINYLRDGNDFVGLHPDPRNLEGAYGNVPTLSLGATRVCEWRRNRDGYVVRQPLPSGALVCMLGEMQVYWQHRVPRAPDVTAGRISLTFRRLLPASPEAAGASAAPL
jgi:alkylated DNA repair dioxygenase AlkB